MGRLWYGAGLKDTLAQSSRVHIAFINQRDGNQYRNIEKALQQELNSAIYMTLSDLHYERK